MKKLINLLTVLVMVSVNVFTPFSYAEVETGAVVDVEEPIIIDELVNEIPKLDNEGNNSISGNVLNTEEHMELIELELPIVSKVGSGDVVSMSGLNNDIDDEYGTTELSGLNNIEEEKIEDELYKSIIQENQVNDEKEIYSSEFLELEKEKNTLITFSQDNPYIVHDEANGLITVYSKDYSYGITLQDKNLGAESIGDTGLYYQRGNNRGNPVDSVKYVGYLEWKDYYNNVGYTGENLGFVYPGYYSPYDIWLDKVLHNNVWGGGSDTDTSDPNIVKGYNIIEHRVENVDGRKGPCEQGYHVPSAGEWNELVSLFFDAYNKKNILEEYSWGYRTFYDTDLLFIKELHIPYSFSRSFVDGELSMGGNLNSAFRSSSPYGEGSEYGISVSVNNHGYVGAPGYSIRGNGFSIRCFKNEYVSNSKTVTYNPNGGAFSGMEIGISKEYKYIDIGNKIIPIYNIQIPNKESTGETGWMFAGWYTKSGVDGDWGEEFDVNNKSTNIAYAKWLPFKDLEVKLGDISFTIMDRNMGAEDVSDGIYYENYAKFGYYYQWGNNYGFKNNTYKLNSGTDLVSNPYNKNSPWGPNNYFYGSDFIKRTGSPYRWNKENNWNLWGGENLANSDIDRQGPCPRGYHIPNRLEWNAVYLGLSGVQSTECIGSLSQIGKCLASKLRLPFPGKRDYGDANVSGQGSSALYWSSSSYPDDNNSYSLSLSYDKIRHQNTSFRVYGCSVRCFKNSSNDKTLTFKVNGNIVKEQRFRWREPVTSEVKPNNPERENSIFDGWYIDGGNEKFEFSTSSFITGDVVLSPKFKCKPGYIETQNGQLCERIRVEFDTNSGLFTDGSNKISVDISNILVPQEVTKISHTPNLTDEGSFVTSYDDSIYNGTYGGKSMKFYQPSYIDSIGIEGVDELKVSVRYAGNYCNRNNSIVTKYIWTGEHLGYTELNGNSSFLSIFTAPSVQGEIEEINRTISGDTITIYKGSGCPDYGRYAVITGVIMHEEGMYTVGAFDNIPEPTREGYIFSGWYLDNGTFENLFDKTNVSTGEITKVYARRICDGICENEQENNNSSKSNSSGGGRKFPSTNNIPTLEIIDKKEEHNSADDKQNISQIIDNVDDLSEGQKGGKDNNQNSIQYTQEQKDAYSFAKSNGITTTSTIKDAKMNTNITRIEMAKMLSYYAINVLGKTPDISKTIKFKDVSSKKDKQYNNGVTLAYQLGIMGQNVKNNKFRPNDEVTRAELVTSLSRMLYGTPEGTNKGTSKYYEPHMAKLYNEGIITNTDPNLKEKRGYLMTMLMRNVSK